MRILVELEQFVDASSNSRITRTLFPVRNYACGTLVLEQERIDLVTSSESTGQGTQELTLESQLNVRIAAGQRTIRTYSHKIEHVQREKIHESCEIFHAVVTDFWTGRKCENSSFSELKNEFLECLKNGNESEVERNVKFYDQSWVCILVGDKVHVYALNTGDYYTVDLPFKTRQMFAYNGGLVFLSIEGGLFFLSDPLKLPSPVQKLRETDDFAKQKVIYVDPKTNILYAYDFSASKLVLYGIFNSERPHQSNPDFTKYISSLYEKLVKNYEGESFYLTNSNYEDISAQAFSDSSCSLFELISYRILLDSDLQFFTSRVEDQILVFLHSKRYRTLKLYSFDTIYFDLKEVLKIDCNDVAGIIDDRFLILDENLQLFFYQKDRCIFHVVPEQKIHGIISFYDSQIIATNSNGIQTRYKVQLEPNSVLVRDCIEMIKYALPAHLAFCFQYDFMQYLLSQKNSQSEWLSFNSYLIFVFEKSSQTENISCDLTKTNAHLTVDYLSFRQYQKQVLENLHFLFESMKINLKYNCNVKQLALTLYVISKACESSLFVIYSRFIETKESSRKTDHIKGETFFGDNFNIFSHLNSILLGKDSKCEQLKICLNHKIIPDSVKFCQKLFTLYEILAGVNNSNFVDSINFKDFEALFNPDPLSYLEKILVYCFFEKLTIEDFSFLDHGVSLPIFEVFAKLKQLPEDKGLHRVVLACSGLSPSVTYNQIYEKLYCILGRVDLFQLFQARLCSKSSCNTLNSKLRFARDDRTSELFSLLRSDLVLTVGSISCSDALDQAYKTELQSKLALTIRQALSGLIGRGLYTYGTYKPHLSEKMDVPEINLSGKVGPRNAIVKLDLANMPSDFLEWPSFHNGTSTALQVCPNYDNEAISRSWILFNTASQEDLYCGGFLLGLGIRRQIAALSKADIYTFLSKKNESISIGILLGLSSQWRATQNYNISKLLCIHIPALLGPEYSERISPHVQTAAVFGLGLVHQSSCQRLMVELSLNEIGRRPSERSGIASSYPDARNSYALAAGFSLGLLCLGKGGSEKAFGLRDLNVEARLLNYIWGDFEASAKSRPQNDDDSSSCVLEVIDNPSVTAVPALIALGLMYMKTNNKSVADQIGIPENPFLLERIRIDQLLMLALVRHLILWDEISPSKLWVQQKIPEYLNLKRTGESSSQTEFICAKLYIAAGCSIAVGLKYAGTYDKEAYDFLYDETYLLWKDLKRCSESSKSVSLAMKTSLAVTAIALSMVVAGSGNLDAFKLFRAIRKSALFFNESYYGKSMAINIALGNLFLSGGTLTYSNDINSVAMLLCSLITPFPSDEADNKHHLQALRHFSALAVESRYLSCVDFESKQECIVPFKVYLKDQSVLDVIAPCILPEFSKISKIEISSPRYLSLSLDFEKNPILESNVRNWKSIFVKRKEGFLSYETDSFGASHITSRLFPRSSITSQNEQYLFNERSKMVKALASDPSLVLFCEAFCRGQSPLSQFSSAVLYDCIAQDKVEALGKYLSLYRIGMSIKIGSDRKICDHIWALKLIDCFYKMCENNKEFQSGKFLIQKSLIDNMIYGFEQHLNSESLESNLSRYISNGTLPKSSNDEISLYSFFIYYDLPDRTKLSMLINRILHLHKSLPHSPLYILLRSESLSPTSSHRLANFISRTFQGVH